MTSAVPSFVVVVKENTEEPFAPLIIPRFVDGASGVLHRSRTVPGA